MDTQEEVSNLTLAKTFKFAKSESVEAGLADLIEAAEMIRRNKIETTKSFSETFFSAAKQYLA